MRAIGYVRVSTDKQADSGLGVAAQKAAILAEAERRGWSEVRMIEDAASGKDTARPGLELARRELAAGAADVLICSKADRLSRSLLDFVSIMEEAQAQRWSLLALDLPADPTTAAGEAMCNVMLVFAQMERRLISERTKAALAAKKAQGVKLGRPPVVSDELRERIRKERARRLTLRAIAENLEADGVATAHGGSRWHASTVRALLNWGS
jgi:DNA invertase Pin-like site-specific DNA recombinase